MSVTTDTRVMTGWRAPARTQLAALLSGLNLVRTALEHEPVAVGPSLRRLSVLAGEAGSWLERHPCPQRAVSDRYRSLVVECQLAGAGAPDTRFRTTGPVSRLEHDIEELTGEVQAFWNSLSLRAGELASGRQPFAVELPAANPRFGRSGPTGPRGRPGRH
jgi:hypothetical protein